MATDSFSLLRKRQDKRRGRWTSGQLAPNPARTTGEPPRTRMQLAHRGLYGGEPAEVSTEFESVATGAAPGPTSRPGPRSELGEPVGRSTRSPRDPG